MKKLIAILIFLPVKTFAVATSLVQGVNPKCLESGDCNLEGVKTIISNVLEWSFFSVTSVATILFVYAGFLYISSQGDTGKVKEATTIFRNVAIGFVIILAAIMLIKELLTKLGLTEVSKIIQ